METMKTSSTRSGTSSRKLYVSYSRLLYHCLTIFALDAFSMLGQTVFRRLKHASAIDQSDTTVKKMKDAMNLENECVFCDDCHSGFSFH